LQVSDAGYLEILEKQNPFRAWLEIMDRGFDGKGNFRLKFTLPFRIIPPISRGRRDKEFWKDNAEIDICFERMVRDIW
jgi:hypothetical protein